MDHITLSKHDLYTLLKQAAIEGANRVLQETGLTKTTYTRTDVIRLHGIACYNQSLMYVKWQKKGNGKNSKVTCQRNEFESWLQKFDEENK